MKTTLILCCSIFLLNGCNSPKQGNDIANKLEVESEIDQATSEITLQSIREYKFNEQINEFELKQLRKVNEELLSGEMVEKIINTNWPRVQIQFNQTSNDTVYISIPNSAILTQQMGSAGAKGFMITTTYTFTELKGIKYVSFDFVEGDHAMPGVYSRKSWDETEIR